MSAAVRGTPRVAAQEHTDLAAMAADTIAKGSKSFAAASRLFDPQTRRSARMLYAWCRHCDDVIDQQVFGYGGGAAAASPAVRLRELEDSTDRALRGQRDVPAPFRAVAEVAVRRDLSRDLLFDHLAGFRMDVEGQTFEDFDDTLRYCYHVAGVVGIMMARIMGASEQETLDRACDLGLAFQLTNMARDIVPDARIGRCYLPARWLAEADLKGSDLLDPRQRPVVALLANRLVDAAEPYYASALHGLRALPLRSAWAVATAHGVYREIGIRIKARKPSNLEERVFTTRARKIAHVMRGATLAVSSPSGTVPPRSPLLWTRPERGAGVGT